MIGVEQSWRRQLAVAVGGGSVVVVKVVVEKETGTVVVMVVVVEEEEVEVVLEWVVLVLAAVAVHLDRLLELGGVHLTHLSHLRRGASRHAAGDARRARSSAVQREGRGAAGEQCEDVAPHGETKTCA